MSIYLAPLDEDDPEICIKCGKIGCPCDPETCDCEPKQLELIEGVS